MSVRSPVSASIMRSATVAIALLAFVSSAFPARADMVTDWNVIALDTIPATISGPPHARLMGYVQAAVFDAVNSVERKYAPYAVDRREPRASPEVAAAVAAHGMLVRFYPAQKAILDAKLNASLAPIPDGDAKTAGTDLGRTVAEQLYNLSLKDGGRKGSGLHARHGPVVVAVHGSQYGAARADLGRHQAFHAEEPRPVRVHWTA